MKQEDISAILEVDRKLAGYQRAVTYTDLISANPGGSLDFSFVGEVGGRIVGFILARHAFLGQPVADAGLIQILGVDPDFWGRGIATRLIGAVLERSKESGLRAVRVMLSERDTRLQGFFVHMGFRRGQLIDYGKTL
jgi:predicted N-acetyltransferase YhbS